MKNYLSKIFILLALISQMGLQSVMALEDTFNTTLTVVAEDFNAPTIPANLVATAISTSQINLSWDASTDDVGVVGYRIFRDSTIIASTTNTTYSDIGLSASTTYVYNVEAFDAIPRYSGQSDSATSTTLAPQAPTPASGSSGSVIKPAISELIVTPSLDSALIGFNTSQQTISRIYWGKTKDYELGSISGVIYNTNHVMKIENLNPATRYYFKVEVTNTHGSSAMTESEFITQNLVKYVVLNVTDFKAVPNKNDNAIQLTWNNPRNNFNFENVRVVRSDKFFPSDPTEGEIVYEGRGENYTDYDVEEGVTYYYSIFVKDNEGNYSSGALAQSRILMDGEVAATSTDPFGGINIVQNVHPDIAKLTLLDFDFIQDGIKIESAGDTIAIDGSKNLTIILDYEKIPEVLKTIAFTLTDPEDSTKVFPFLLRVNNEKTAYEATIAPLGKSGNYGLHVVILDYKNQGLLRLEGNLRAFVFGSIQGILSTDTNIFRNNYLLWIWIVLIGAMVYVLGHLNRKRHEA